MPAPKGAFRSTRRGMAALNSVTVFVLSVSDLEYWSLVVGGRGCHNQLLQAKCQKKNKKGELQTLKNGEAWLEYVPLSTLHTRCVKDFATKMEVLSATEKEIKEVFNELKCLLRSSRRFLVVYHPGTDPCSMCYGNHYHIILGRHGHKDMDKEYRYRRMRQAARGDGPMELRKVYTSYQRVRSLSALVKYLSHSPRVFYGTNVKQWIDWIMEERGESQKLLYDDSFVEDAEASDVLGVDEEADTDDLGYGMLDLPVEGDDFEVAPKKKRGQEDWADAGDDEDQPFKRIRGEKLDFIPRLIVVTAYIMFSCRTTDKSQLRLMLDKRAARRMPESHNMIARIKNVLFHKQVNRIWEAAVLEYRSRINRQSFGELCQWAWNTMVGDPDREDKFIPLGDSVGLLLEWLAEMNHKPKEFLENCRQVLKRQSGKLNCVFCMGVSNAGKTVMFTKPLEFIMAGVGRIVSLNVSDRFIFEACVGQRLISIEECLIPKMHQEEIKKLMGGEDCQISVKYAKEGALLRQTPVIATANQPPWTLDYALEQPIRNRMYYYEFVKPFCKLENWQTKQLDPRAYLVCWSAISSGMILSDLFNDEVLQTFVDELQETMAPTVDPLDDLGNYPVHCAQAFDFSFTDRDMILEGYLGTVPVFDPGTLHKRRCDKWPVLAHIHHCLSTEPSDFWLNNTRMVGEFRIAVRFTNCAFGKLIGVTAAEVPDVTVSNCRFDDWSARMELTEPGTVTEFNEQDIKDFAEYFIEESEFVD